MLNKLAQELKEKTNCIEIAQICGLPINKSGDRTTSPFHSGSNNQSFVCKENFWYSFSDSMGGDFIDLYAELKTGGSRGKAIIELAKMFNIYSYDEDLRNNWDEKTQKLCNQIAYWHEKLRDEDREYLHSRNITDETINKLRIGYSQIDNALCIPYYKNGYVYDYILRKYEGKPRYKRMANGDDKKTPWGLPTLSIQDKPLYLVEGTFDGVAIYQAGCPVLVTTNPDINYLLTHDVILCYDNDKPGMEYTLKVAKSLFLHNKPFKIARFPTYCKDIADFLVKNSLADCEYISGNEFIGKTLTKADELAEFIRKIARNTSETTISQILDNTGFSDATKKIILKQATQSPSESYISEEIIKDNNLIYVDQDSFYMFNGKIWEKTNDTTIKNLADKYYGKQFSTAHKCAAVCNLLKARTLTDITFNKKPVISFINGTLELDSGTFREHSELDYCSFMMNYPYSPNLRSEKWINFIDEITAGDEIKKELLQFIAGYVLFPDCRFQKIFALIGDGSNGKSVYLEVLQKVFGDKNCTSIEPEGLNADFKCIHLKDSLLNVASEIDEDFSKSEKMLKKISAGEECIACYKTKDYIKFYPRSKLIFACNEMPKTNIVKGLDRRLLFIHFPVKFVDDVPFTPVQLNAVDNVPIPNNPYIKKKDVNLLPKLLKELPAIFNWVYEGYKDLRDIGYFTQTTEQEQFIEQFKENSNPIVVFCNDYVFSGEMTRKQLYNLYRDWCNETNHKPLSREKFIPAFRDRMKDKIECEKTTTRNGEKVRFFIFKPAP